MPAKGAIITNQVGPRQTEKTVSISIEWLETQREKLITSCSLESDLTNFFDELEDRIDNRLAFFVSVFELLPATMELRLERTPDLQLRRALHEELKRLAAAMRKAAIDGAGEPLTLPFALSNLINGAFDIHYRD